ncbi:MAG: hypothetical protein IPK79_10125 [Vampirovibrionales bacterium]|nr:hypothetical protein [Vampirovibrionales bacterium]
MPKGNNRWYDKYPQTQKAVELFEQLSSQYQRLIAKNIAQFCEDNNLLGGREGLKSLGHTKVMGLIQSKAKRRWYDQDQLLHKAVNSILMMTDEDRQAASYRMVVTIESFEAYMEWCQQNERLIDIDELEQMAADVFTRPVDELLNLTSPEPAGLPPGRLPESAKTVIDDDAGMKIRMDD